MESDPCVYIRYADGVSVYIHTIFYFIFIFLGGVKEKLIHDVVAAIRMWCVCVLIEFGEEGRYRSSPSTALIIPPVCVYTTSPSLCVCVCLWCALYHLI